VAASIRFCNLCSKFAAHLSTLLHIPSKNRLRPLFGALHPAPERFKNSQPQTSTLLLKEQWGTARAAPALASHRQHPRPQRQPQLHPALAPSQGIPTAPGASSPGRQDHDPSDQPSHPTSEFRSSFPALTAFTQRPAWPKSKHTPRRFSGKPQLQHHLPTAPGTNKPTLITGSTLQFTFPKHETSAKLLWSHRQIPLQPTERRTRHREKK